MVSDCQIRHSLLLQKNQSQYSAGHSLGRADCASSPKKRGSAFCLEFSGQLPEGAQKTGQIPRFSQRGKGSAQNELKKAHPDGQKNSQRRVPSGEKNRSAREKFF